MVCIPVEQPCMLYRELQQRLGVCVQVNVMLCSSVSKSQRFDEIVIAYLVLSGVQPQDIILIEPAGMLIATIPGPMQHSGRGEGEVDHSKLVKIMYEYVASLCQYTTYGED